MQKWCFTPILLMSSHVESQQHCWIIQPTDIFDRHFFLLHFLPLHSRYDIRRKIALKYIFRPKFPFHPKNVFIHCNPFSLHPFHPFNQKYFLQGMIVVITTTIRQLLLLVLFCSVPLFSFSFSGVDNVLVVVVIIDSFITFSIWKTETYRMYNVQGACWIYEMIKDGKW